MTATPSVFDYEDYRTFLKNLQSCYPGRRKAVTLEQMARLLGYKSPRTFAMVVKGQRLPSRDLLHRLTSRIQLSAQERQYLELLILKEKYEKQGGPVDTVLLELKRLRGKSYPEKKLSVDSFQHISEWYFTVIEQLLRTIVTLPRTDAQLRWMQKKLKGALPLETLLAAINRLELLGLAQVPTSQEATTLRTPSDIPSEAIRGHHRQMLHQAVKALDEQITFEREFVSHTLRFDPKDLSQAKKKIREFVKDFNREFYKEKSSEIFQLNLQLFGHTDPSVGDLEN